MTNEEKEQLEQLRAKEAKEKKSRSRRSRKGMFSKIVIVLAFTYLFYFTERVFQLFKLTGTEPSTLITAVFGALLGEFGLMAWIKNTKVKKGD